MSEQRDPVNSDNADVASVAAALADAHHAGGLSDAYYASANAALKRLANEFESMVCAVADADMHDTAPQQFHGFDGLPDEVALQARRARQLANGARQLANELLVQEQDVITMLRGAGIAVMRLEGDTTGRPDDVRGTVRNALAELSTARARFAEIRDALEIIRDITGHRTDDPLIRDVHHEARTVLAATPSDGTAPERAPITDAEALAALASRHPGATITWHYGHIATLKEAADRAAHRDTREAEGPPSRFAGEPPFDQHPNRDATRPPDGTAPERADAFAKLHADIIGCVDRREELIPKLVASGDYAAAAVKQAELRPLHNLREFARRLAATRPPDGMPGEPDLRRRIGSLAQRMQEESEGDGAPTSAFDRGQQLGCRYVAALLRKILAGEDVGYEPAAPLTVPGEPDGDGGVGFSIVDGPDASGEMRMQLDVRGHVGDCWLSREMWQAIGERAAWAAPPTVPGEPPQRSAADRDVLESIAFSLDAYASEMERRDRSIDASRIRTIAARVRALAIPAERCDNCRHFWHRRGLCSHPVSAPNNTPGRPWSEPSEKPSWCPGWESLVDYDISDPPHCGDCGGGPGTHHPDCPTGDPIVEHPAPTSFGKVDLDGDLIPAMPPAKALRALSEHYAKCGPVEVRRCVRFGNLTHGLYLLWVYVGSDKPTCYVVFRDEHVELGNESRPMTVGHLAHFVSNATPEEVHEISTRVPGQELDEEGLLRSQRDVSEDHNA